MKSHPGPRGDGHGHDPKELSAGHTREQVLRHLVDGHHWPAVAHYEATGADLDDLHRMYHDPSRTAEAVERTRTILGMPDSPNGHAL